MFLVMNRQKIYSYVIAVFTVVVLFVVAASYPLEDSILASAGTSRKIPIYSVDRKEKKVAFTMNCAWNADDIDQILEILEKKQVQITFFMVGDWVTKYPEAVKKIADKRT